MTTPIAFESVPSPALNDAADGVKAFNGIATAGENNFTKINAWAPHAQTSLVRRSSIDGAALFAPAPGWSVTASQVSHMYGRKWLGVTYLRIEFTRQGAAITAGSRNNITDTLIGTVAAGWRPTINNLHATGSLYNCTPVNMALETDGELKVAGFSFPGQVWATGWYGILQIAFTDYGVL